MISNILIDLDDTVYPPESGVWELIRNRINLYMRERLKIPEKQIPGLRESLFRQYGTTMRGLQTLYQIDPWDYLNFVHDVPVADYLKANNELQNALDQIPQPKIIFTNADKYHAARVLKALNIFDCFTAIIDIMDIDPYCKPQTESFVKVFKLIQCTHPSECLFLDDRIENLMPAKALGVKTILVNPSNSSHDGILHIPRLIELPNIIGFIE